MRSGFAMQDFRETKSEKNSSAEFPRSTYGRLLPKGRKNSAEKKIGNLTFELRSLATEGTQEFPPLNFHLRALSIMNYEL